MFCSFWQLITLLWLAPFIGQTITIYFFLLAICLLSCLKKQMPKVSRITVNQMPLHPHLSLSMSLTTPNFPPAHIVPCLLEVARLQPAPLYPKSLGCLNEGFTPAPDIHIPRVWNVGVEIPSQAPSQSCLSPNSAPRKSNKECPLPRDPQNYSPRVFKLTPPQRTKTCISSFLFSTLL